MKQLLFTTFHLPPVLFGAKVDCVSDSVDVSVSLVDSVGVSVWLVDSVGVTVSLVSIADVSVGDGVVRGLIIVKLSPQL